MFTAAESYLSWRSVIVICATMFTQWINGQMLQQQSEETLRINLKTGNVLGFSEFVHFEAIIKNNEIWNQSTVHSGKKGGRNHQHQHSSGNADTSDDQSDDYNQHRHRHYAYRRSCSMQALLKIDLSGPFSALKFTFFFNRPKLWTVHLSQSQRDYGFGKILSSSPDGATSAARSSSPSLQIHNRQLSLYGGLLMMNDAPPGATRTSGSLFVGPPPTPTLLVVRDDAMPRRARSTVSLTLEQKSVKWDLKPFDSRGLKPIIGGPTVVANIGGGGESDGTGEDDSAMPNNDNWQLQSEQLFDFHSPNASYLYVGLNRAVGAAYKYGTGLCEVHIVMQRAREKRDECTGGNQTCDFNAECKDTKSSFRCVCKAGFKGNGHVCRDENECDFLNGHCVQTCTNTEGGYYCSCYPGFKLAANKRDCLDVDECRNENGLCEHDCENTIGSYRCACRRGYTLAADGFSCVDGAGAFTTSLADTCSHLGCAHGCHEARRLCYCKSGYKLHGNGRDCVPTCEIGNGGCQHKCFDLQLGPICGCHPDYFLSMDNRTCVASCAIDNGGCERMCENTPIGVRCLCPHGYRLSREDNKTCIDVDECSFGNGGCQSICVNTHGSFECRCPNGYLLDADQKSCVDIDECKLINANEYDKETCHHECVNTPGSYECKCRAGYHMYAGRFCADIDECSDDNGGCQQSCANTAGSYLCTCQPGYQLHYNRKDCQLSNCDPVIATDYSPASVRFDHRYLPSAYLSCHAHRFSSFYLRPSSKFNFHCSSDRCEKTDVADGKVEIRAVVDSCDVAAITENNVHRYARHGTGSKSCESSHFSLCSLDVNCEQLAVLGSTKTMAVLSLKGVLSQDTGSRSGYSRRFRLHAFAERWRDSVTSDSIKFYHHGVTYTIKAGRKDTNRACRRGLPILASDKAVCARCDPGTYFNTSYGFCLPCPIGSYQPEADSLSCRPCPSSFSMVIGASKLDDCGGLCEAGQYSATGMAPCMECPKGFYQPNPARTECKSCGGQLTTLAGGSKHFGDCTVRARCSEGYFYDLKRDGCFVCPLGTYQTRREQNYCTHCPANMTTDYAGSTSLGQCKYKYCRSRIGRLGGFLESANFPDNYPNNVQCTWVLRAPRGHRLLIFVPELRLAADRCRDYLVMRKNASPYSAITFEGCESNAQPLAIIARSRRLWIQFRTDAEKTDKGFHLRYVSYQDQYHPLIEDIVRDSRLYTSPNYKSIFENRRFLEAFIDVISEPNNYRKYLNMSASVFPRSFLDILWPKIHRFFDLGDL